MGRIAYICKVNTRRQMKALSKYSPPLQLILFLAFIVIGILLTTMLGLLFGQLIFGETIMKASTNPDLHNSTEINALKFLQTISHLGLFIIPSLAFAWFAGKNHAWHLGFQNKSKLAQYLFAIVLIVAAQPLINWLTEFNAGLKLPSGFAEIEAWMKQAEESAALLTDAFMNTHSFGGLIFNLFMMALIPAFGEEFVFRGILQRLLQQWTRKAWVAILISSVIFSAIHMQFYGFIPRLMIGALLGLVFWKTGNLWLCILIHFINNGMAVVVSWLFANQYSNIPMENFGNFNNDILLLLLFTIVFSLSLFMILRQKTQKLIEPKQLG